MNFCANAKFGIPSLNTYSLFAHARPPYFYFRSRTGFLLLLLQTWVSSSISRRLRAFMSLTRLASRRRRAITVSRSWACSDVAVLVPDADWWLASTKHCHAPTHTLIITTLQLLQIAILLYKLHWFTDLLRICCGFVTVQLTGQQIEPIKSDPHCNSFWQKYREFAIPICNTFSGQVLMQWYILQWLNYRK